MQTSQFLHLVKCHFRIFIVLFFGYSTNVFSQVELDFFRYPGITGTSFNKLAREVSSRTSIELKSKPVNFEKVNQNFLDEPWIWIKNTEGLTDKNGGMNAALVRWLKRGGFIVIESGNLDDAVWDRFVYPLTRGSFRNLGWTAVPQDHELMRSFYLLATLPSCSGQLWRWYGIDGRLAMLQIPYQFSSLLHDNPAKPGCDSVAQLEYQYRVFTNILMVALTTDYKRDQIHLPEILKRLRSL